MIFFIKLNTLVKLKMNKMNLMNKMNSNILLLQIIDDNLFDYYKQIELNNETNYIDDSG